MNNSTNFQKENFSWDGMYLNYTGDQGIHAIFYINNGQTHPSRVGTQRDMFIARFKHGSKPWKTWVNFIVKNFTVEEWVSLVQQGLAPTEIMSSKGFIHSTERKLMKEFGLKVTFSNIAKAWEMFQAKQEEFQAQKFTSNGIRIIEC